MIDDPLLAPVGVLRINSRTTLWRVWASKAERVDLVLDPEGQARRVSMTAEPRGYFVRETEAVEDGQRYAYSLDGGTPLPDPLSRWQPDGVMRPSAVFDPARFAWNEGGWKGIDDPLDLVFYELHVGTFTPQATFEAVIPRLPELRDLGITAVELMPVAQFSGQRGWGYDGVHPFAPQNSFGGPLGLQKLVEACHRIGLAVFLDVVYNHLGPEGNVFPAFGHYFNERYQTDWGPAVNFDGPHCDQVRAVVLDNVRMWIRDYRFDGLRLDAADQIYDRSPSPVLAEIAELAHQEAEAQGRRSFVFAETDMNQAARFLGPPDRGGYGLDGQWNDDFHHSAHVALSGDASGYFQDFDNGPASLAKVLQHGFANNGNFSRSRNRRHGAPAETFSGSRFVAFIQNHDQIANGSAGDRIASRLCSSAVRLAAGLLLLSPRLPLLFQGEEYGETNPFSYFCDFHDPGLIESVRKGRAREFAHFHRPDPPPDPVSPKTREMAVLSWSWDEPERRALRRLYRDLLTLRRTEAALRDYRPPTTHLLEPGDVLEFARGEGADRLRLVFNLSGQERALPAELATERPLFRSEIPDYGAQAPSVGQRSTHLRPHEFQVFRRR